MHLWSFQDGGLSARGAFLGPKMSKPLTKNKPPRRPSLPRPAAADELGALTGKMTTMLAMQGMQGMGRMMGGMWGILGMFIFALICLLVIVALVLLIIFLVKKVRQ